MQLCKSLNFENQDLAVWVWSGLQGPFGRAVADQQCGLGAYHVCRLRVLQLGVNFIKSYDLWKECARCLCLYAHYLQFMEIEVVHKLPTWSLDLGATNIWGWESAWSAFGQPGSPFSGAAQITGRCLRLTPRTIPQAASAHGGNWRWHPAEVARNTWVLGGMKQHERTLVFSVLQTWLKETKICGDRGERRRRMHIYSVLMSFQEPSASISSKIWIWCVKSQERSVQYDRGYSCYHGNVSIWYSEVWP